MTNSSKVIAAELISPRTTCHTVADAVTIVSPTAATNDQPRHDPRHAREGKSGRRHGFRDAQNPLEPPRQRGIHLHRDLRRRRDEGPSVGEERGREQHLHDPKDDVHDVTLPPLLRRRTRKARIDICYRKTGCSAGAVNGVRFNSSAGARRTSVEERLARSSRAAPRRREWAERAGRSDSASVNRLMLRLPRLAAVG